MSAPVITGPDKLWCVNIQGPDDIYACESKEQADRLAANMNAAWKRQARDLDITYNAIVIPWPYTVSGHADDLRNTRFMWGAWLDIVFADLPAVEEHPAND